MKHIIVDLDGTLALNEHREYFITNGYPDWDSYFRACTKDLPNQPIIEIVNTLYRQNYTIHIFSGRSDIVKDETLTWLKKYGVKYHTIRMRRQGDYIPDEVLKKNWLLEFYPNYKDDIFCVFDDRNKVVNMWRKLGLNCLQVAEGNF